MNQDQVNQLRLELKAFSRLTTSNSINTITNAYNRISVIVQAIMLNSDNPDAHARAWSLLNDDAYKDLTDVQEGRGKALTDLKFKICQVGELLLESKG